MNHSVFTAVLVDTVGIQNYIFSSNRLKDNIGASHIVAKVFEQILPEILRKVVADRPPDRAWYEDPQTIHMTQGNIAAEIGYIGGGNALIFFRNKEKAFQFIKMFTRTLLERTPGLHTAFGCIDDFRIDNFKDDMKRLHEKLRENKSSVFPNVTLMKYGFTAECPRTGESAEAILDERKLPISSVIHQKTNAAYLAREELQKELNNKLQRTNKCWKLTNDMEELGQVKNEFNYIAVVHIDGNQMGARIQQCPTLASLRKLSISVQKATHESFQNMVLELIEAFESNRISTADDVAIEKDDYENQILPIRPIIIGGDDITFVCHGKLGVWLSERFIQSFMNKKVSDEHRLTACAGIAIVKTKYPFFRAYTMALHLMEQAKKLSRKSNGESCLDFFISSGGFLTPRNLRDDAPCGRLHFGPYFIGKEKNYKDIVHIKNIIKELRKLPRHKLYQLRDVLHKDEVTAQQFIDHLTFRGFHLPGIESRQYHKKLWQDRETPYFDAIELLEFYPEGLL